MPLMPPCHTLMHPVSQITLHRAAIPQSDADIRRKNHVKTSINIPRSPRTSKLKAPYSTISLLDTTWNCWSFIPQHRRPILQAHQTRL